MKKKVTLPFSKKQIYLSLDPFCPAALEDELAELLSFLVDEGFKNWVVNNPAHITMLRGKQVPLIGGPYLYTFNRWAVSWLENQNVQVFISPLENSRRNLEATYEMSQRGRVLVPIFAYPALFRMRFKLPTSYDFTFFSDKEGLTFKALSTPDGSFVMPENPFSIVDKVQFLKKAGFTHYLIDMSKTHVHKKHFRQIVSAMMKNQILPDTGIFNWKDGFYSPEKMEEYKQAKERAGDKKTAGKTKGQQSGKTGTAKNKASNQGNKPKSRKR